MQLCVLRKGNRVFTRELPLQKTKNKKNTPACTTISSKHNCNEEVKRSDFVCVLWMFPSQGLIGPAGPTGPPGTRGDLGEMVSAAQAWTSTHEATLSQVWPLKQVQGIKMSWFRRMLTHTHLTWFYFVCVSLLHEVYLSMIHHNGTYSNIPVYWQMLYHFTVVNAVYHFSFQRWWMTISHHSHPLCLQATSLFSHTLKSTYSCRFSLHHERYI